MPKQTLRRREQKAAAFEVRSGTAVRRAMTSEEASELFQAMDWNRPAGFGIRKLSKLDVDGLHEAPDGVSWERQVTLLYYAAWRKRDFFIKALLDAGADPAIRHGVPNTDGIAKRYVQSLRPALAVWFMRALVRLRFMGSIRVARGTSGVCGICATSPDSQPLSWEQCGHFVCEACLWERVQCLGVEGAELVCPTCGVCAQDSDAKRVAVDSSANAGEAIARKARDQSAKACKRCGKLEKPCDCGDWACGACGYTNFARRLDCRNCGTVCSQVSHKGEECFSDGATTVETFNALAYFGIQRPPAAELRSGAEEESDPRVSTSRNSFPNDHQLLLPSVSTHDDHRTALQAKRLNRRLESYGKWAKLPIKAFDVICKTREKFRALDANAAAASRLGDSQEERTNELFKAACSGAIRRLAYLVDAGVNINAANEYGQTAIFLAASRGRVDFVQCLLETGADVDSQAHGGSTASVVAAARSHNQVLYVLEGYGADMHRPGSEGKTAHQYAAARMPTLADEAGTSQRRQSVLGFARYLSRYCLCSCIEDGARPPHSETPSLRTLISPDSTHPGAGSYYLDGCFDDKFLRSLESLFESLPVAEPEKESPNDRSYFCDSEGWIQAAFGRSIGKVAALLDGSEYVCIMPQMRFLNYTQVGGGLPAHLDLSRTNDDGIRSTHTFLVYLTACHEGGETVLLEGVDDPDKTLAVVAPRRGRLLLFPHQCPHLARPVVHVPKLLLRGEAMLRSRARSVAG